jgi:hypothetical protein
MAGEPRHHRRRSDEDRGPVAVDELDEGIEGEARQRHGRRPRRQGVGEGDDEAHDVREGRDRDDRVALAQLQRGARLPHGGHEVRVVSITPLGRPVVPLEYGSSATARAGSSATAGAGPSASISQRHDLAHAGRHCKRSPRAGLDRRHRGRLGLRAQSRLHVALVADRGWPAGDYVERTVASIMAEVVAPARDE